mgnify:CR=1 FL=1
MVSALANRMSADVANLTDRHRSDLTLEERQDYIRAVYCLMEQPSLTQFEAPGAQHRFDDYVVIHVQQTHRNHGSVSLATLANPHPWESPEDLLTTPSPFPDFLPPLAPLLRLALRILPAYPMRVQRLPAGEPSGSPSLSPHSSPPNTIALVLELGPLRRRPRQLAPLRWQRRLHGQRRLL